MICEGCDREVAECLGYGSYVPRLKSEIAMLREVISKAIASYDKEWAASVGIVDEMRRALSGVGRDE